MKNKKLLLSLSALTLFVPPVIASISCSSDPKPNTEDVTRLNEAVQWITNSKKIVIVAPNRGSKTNKQLEAHIIKTQGFYEIDETEMKDSIGLTSITLKDKPSYLHLSYKLVKKTPAVSQGHPFEFNIIFKGVVLDSGGLQYEHKHEVVVRSSDYVGQIELDEYRDNIAISAPAIGKKRVEDLDTFIRQQPQLIKITDQAKADRVRESIGLTSFDLKGAIPEDYLIDITFVAVVNGIGVINEYHLTMFVYRKSISVLESRKTITVFSSDERVLTDSEIVKATKDFMGTPQRIVNKTIAEYDALVTDPNPEVSSPDFTQKTIDDLGIRLNFPELIEGLTLKYTVTKRSESELPNVQVHYDVVITIKKGLSSLTISFYVISSDRTPDTDENIIRTIKGQMGMPENLNNATIEELETIRDGQYNDEVIRQMGIAHYLPDDLKRVQITFRIVAGNYIIGQKVTFTVTLQFVLNDATDDMLFMLTSSNDYSEGNATEEEALIPYITK